ncbi:hypothetical protein F5882DRAFT_463409 [Hyaloscypha sp. PMI_1271]|nr:hypothetical protein F5882DRAFT_463409 [Hyaloscypha sp. PMI_1271]
MGVWASDQARGNRNKWRQFERESSGLPGLELVFADYEGRGQAIPWDGMRKGSWMYSKAVADWRGLHCTRTGRNIQSKLDDTSYENTWNIGYGECLIVLSNGFTKLKTRKTEILVSKHNKGPLKHKYRHSPKSQEVESAATSHLGSGQPSEDLFGCSSEFPSWSNSNSNTQALGPAEAFSPFVGLQFALFPKFPPELRHMSGIMLLGSNPALSLSPHPILNLLIPEPTMATDRENFKGGERRSEDEDFQGAIHQDMDTKIGLDLSNDTFMLQMMGQESTPPDLCQKEAYDKVRNWYERENRRAIHTGRLPPFSLSLFKATKSLSRSMGEREIGRFEIGVSAGPVLPSIYREVDERELYEIEDVAIRLALPPFDYHYGAGDDRFDAGGGIDRGVQDRDGQSVGGDGQNEDDLTNLEWWVRGKMFITLETRCEEYMTAITPCVITSLPSGPFA